MDSCRCPFARVTPLVVERIEAADSASRYADVVLTGRDIVGDHWHRSNG